MVIYCFSSHFSVHQSFYTLKFIIKFVINCKILCCHYMSLSQVLFEHIWGIIAKNVHLCILKIIRWYIEFVYSLISVLALAPKIQYRSALVVTLWILAPITYIESSFEGELLIASMSRRNDYSEENLFQCSYEHLTVVLRLTWKAFLGQKAKK